MTKCVYDLYQNTLKIIMYPFVVMILFIIQFVNLFNYNLAVKTFIIIMKFFMHDATKDKDYYLSLYHLKMFHKKHGLI